MPELPEVETTRRGLAPHVVNQRIRTAIVRNAALRLPVPRRLPQLVAGATIRALERRGKYLLIDCGTGTLIVHLGMSGRLWLVDASDARGNARPFRSRAGEWTRSEAARSAPLWPRAVAEKPAAAPVARVDRTGAAVCGFRRRVALHGDAQSISRDQARADGQPRRRGVGNIYASEALFRAGINPKLPAQRIGRARYAVLAEKIRETLEAAIQAGGSTLRDYVGGDGRAGYFQDEHLVYGRGGEPCLKCGTAIREIRQGQRSTFYCPACQRR